MTAIAEKGQARDLEADLAICEAATPGPWEFGTNAHPELSGKPWGWIKSMGSRIAVWSGSNNPNFYHDNRFMSAAREGWPYAIRRALEAEAEVDRLRNELNILQEQWEERGDRFD